MPVTIGAKRESDFADPLGMLSDCHRRVERFLQALIEVTSQAKGESFTTEQKTAFENGLRYFQEAAPKLAELYQRHIHLEDNEVFPAAATMLSTDDRKAIGEEMAFRRGIGRG